MDECMNAMGKHVMKYNYIYHKSYRIVEMEIKNGNATDTKMEMENRKGKPLVMACNKLTPSPAKGGKKTLQP